MDAFQRRAYLAILQGEKGVPCDEKEGWESIFFFHEFKTTLGHLTYGHVKQLGDVSM